MGSGLESRLESRLGLGWGWVGVGLGFGCCNIVLDERNAASLQQQLLTFVLIIADDDVTLLIEILVVMIASLTSVLIRGHWRNDFIADRDPTES